MLDHDDFVLMMFLGSLGSLCGIDGFDIISLDYGTLVRSKASLGKLVNALIGRRSARFDHVENASFVGGQTGHFAGNPTNKLVVFA